MTMSTARRGFLQTFGVAAMGVATASRVSATPHPGPMLSPGASDLRDLMDRLAKAPRRRDFTSVPMILIDREQWDHAAIAEVMAYKPTQKQVWDNTVIESPWLNLMRNSLNTQIFAFGHADFLVISATHGSAHVALYDQGAWDKYQLAKLAGDKFKTNSLIIDKAAPSASAANYQDPHGAFSPDDNSIPMLMRRGVVFMACHNAIWEQGGKLLENGVNPDKLSREALVADLTNHLIEGVVLTPGAVATIPELQHVGYHYIK